MDPLDITCPLCNQRAGEMCVFIGTEEKRESFHPTRVNKAKKEWADATQKDEE